MYGSKGRKQADGQFARLGHYLSLSFCQRRHIQRALPGKRKPLEGHLDALKTEMVQLEPTAFPYGIIAFSKVPIGLPMVFFGRAAAKLRNKCSGFFKSLHLLSLFGFITNSKLSTLCAQKKTCNDDTSGYSKVQTMQGRFKTTFDVCFALIRSQMEVKKSRQPFANEFCKQTSKWNE